MNKYKEAYQNIVKCNCADCTCESMKLLEELVEKATPKKPSKIYTTLKYNNYYCRSCTMYLCNEFLPKPNYCAGCGQVIDWSEEDVV